MVRMRLYGDKDFTNILINVMKQMDQIEQKKTGGVKMQKNLLIFQKKSIQETIQTKHMKKTSQTKHIGILKIKMKL